MTTLNTQQEYSLQTILNNSSLSATARFTSYYQTLASYGVAYGTLAAGISTNTSLNGVLANTYLVNSAASRGIIIDATTAANISLDLARADLAARIALGGGDLAGRDIDTYHAQVFAQYSLLPSDWVMHQPIRLLGDFGWDAMIASGTSPGFVLGAMSLLAANPTGDFTGAVNAINVQNWWTNLGKTFVTVGASAIQALGLPDLSSVVVTTNPDSSFSFAIGPQGDAGSQWFGFKPSGQLAKTIAYSADKIVTTSYNDAGKLTAVNAVYVSGAHADVSYSVLPGTTWYSKTNIYNSSNQLIGTSLVNKDGTGVLTEINPLTGKAVTSTPMSADTKLGKMAVDPNADMLHFMQAVADTLATLLISNVLIKNNLPASIAAQAFADAVIHTSFAPAGQAPNFAQLFANSAFAISGGLAGSQAGALLARALGVPVEAGALIGGVTGNLLTQEIVSRAIAELEGAPILGPGLTATGLANALGGAAGGFLGSQLASLFGPTNLESQIGGAVGAAVLTAILVGNPITAPFELVFAAAFGGDFLGSILGGLFGGHPSVGPNAAAQNAYNAGTHLFYMTGAQKDNGGSTDGVIAESTALNGVMNTVLTAIGGTVDNPQHMSLLWFQGKYYYAFGDQSPRVFPNVSTDPNVIVQQAAFAWLKSLQVHGGNPYMEYMLQKSTASNLADLLKDLDAAKDYSLYAVDPTAFNLAIAMTGDPARLATWQTELARIHTLGLDKLTLPELDGLTRFGYITNANIAQQGTVMGNAFIGDEHDYVLADSARHLTLREFSDRAGILTNSLTLQNADGSLYVAPTGARVVTTAHDVAHTGTFNIFLQASGGGQISFLEIDATGKLLANKPLVMSNGGAFTLNGTAGEILGTSPDFMGSGGYTVFARQADGWVTAWKFDATGHQMGGLAFTNPNGSQFQLATGSHVLYTAHNLEHANTGNFFIQSSTGQISYMEFDAGIHVIKNVPLVMENGGALTLGGAGSEIMKIMPDLTSNGGFTLVGRQTDGWVALYKFDSTGHQHGGIAFTNADGSQYQLPGGAEVIGISHGLETAGNYDVLVRTPDGHVTYASFDASGHQLTNHTLTTSSGPALSFDSDVHILEVTSHALNNLSSLSIVAESHGQVTIWDFDTLGEQMGGLALSKATGGTFASPDGSTFMALEHNAAGHGEIDLVYKLSNGGFVYYQVAGNGQVATSPYSMNVFDANLNAAVTIAGTTSQLNGSVITHYDGVNDVFNITDHPWTSQTTATYTADTNSANQSGLLTLSEGGVPFMSLFIEGGNHVAQFTVSSNGAG